MSTEQSESAPAAVTAPQVEAKAAPAAVTAPQVETKAAPAADITQQATTPTANTERKKDPKRVAIGKMAAEKRRLALEEQKKAAEAYYAEKQRKPPQRPLSQPRVQKKKAQRAAASAPTNGSPLVALAFPCSGSITSVKSSWQWPSPCSTNSKRRSPRCRSPRMSSQNLLAIHGQED